MHFTFYFQKRNPSITQIIIHDGKKISISFNRSGMKRIPSIYMYEIERGIRESIIRDKRQPPLLSKVTYITMKRLGILNIENMNIIHTMRNKTRWMSKPIMP